MAAFFGHAEAMELTVGATLKGCSPPPPSPEGRKVLLAFKVTLQPGQRPAGDLIPQGVTPMPSESNSESSGGPAGPGKGARAGVSGLGASKR
jgi:hypothetical protein